MKFYGKGTIWDKDKDRALARFDKNGEFETDDPRAIQLLKDKGVLGDYTAEDFKLNETLGLDPDPEEEPEPKPPKVKTFDDMTLKELKEEADACGIKYAANIGKKTLADRLKETLK